SRVVGLGLPSAQGGQQQPGQDCNDGDHHKQFNESKGVTRVPKLVVHSCAAVRLKRVCFHKQSHNLVINDCRLGRCFSSSGAVPLSRELDPLFRSEVRKPPIWNWRTEHLAGFAAAWFVVSRSTCLGTLVDIATLPV